MNTVDTPTQDQVFLEKLNEVFLKNFSAKIYPGRRSEVVEAKVNIDEPLTRNQISKILKLSEENSLSFQLKRSGAGLVINFKKTK